MVTHINADVGAVAVRERLLAAAMELFTSKGYAATSVREIVESAGVTKPVLYYWFSSKEGIYLELMESIRSLYDKNVSTLTGSDGTIRDRLLRFFTGMFDGARGNISFVRFAYSIFFGPPQGAPTHDLHRFFDYTLDLVRSLLAEGMVAGEFLPVDPGPATWALVGSYHTIMEEQFCRALPRIDRQGLEQVINLILDGLSPPVLGSNKLA